MDVNLKFHHYTLQTTVRVATDENLRNPDPKDLEAYLATLPRTEPVKWFRVK